MSQEPVFVKVLKAASEGAVGAVVGASLSAVTEPVVNKVLVQRKSVKQAMEEHNVQQIAKFFGTTLPTNFIKFPFFEVVNMIMNNISVPPAVRGTVTGMVFTSATLPITNFRFKKSMDMPTGGLAGLYQAYFPTVLRDIIYGIARNTMMGWITAGNPKIMSTPGGRARAMFMTVLFSCVVSAPGNEYRGYCLQDPAKAKPFMDFFDPVKTARSTTMGGLIMATSLAVAAFSTPFIEAFVMRMKSVLRSDPLGAVILIYLLLDRVMQQSRLQRIEERMIKDKALDKVAHPDAKAKP